MKVFPLFHDSPLLIRIFHCPTEFHLQKTNWKVKLLRISRYGQQSIKPNIGSLPSAETCGMMQAAFPGSRSWIQLTSELTSKLETRGNVSALPSSLSGGGVHRDQGSKVKWKAQGLVSNVPGHEQCFSSYFVLGSLGNGFTILSTLVERRWLLVRGRRFYFIFISGGWFFLQIQQRIMQCCKHWMQSCATSLHFLLQLVL